VQEEAGIQNPERRRTAHIRAGHVDTDQHFVDWKVKGMKCSILSALELAICEIVK
jgi:hypothetical protein